MRFVNGCAMLAMTFLLTGCFLFHRHSQPAEAPPTAPQAAPYIQTAPAPAPKPVPAPQAVQPIKPVVKPDFRVTGQIAMVNADGKFAIITFPPGPVPAPGQQLNVYRNGAKVGELKVTGPQRENDTVADIVGGDVQLRDEARAD